MFLLVSWYLLAAAAEPSCALIGPVAVDAPSARRIAQAIIRNFPVDQMVRYAAQTGRPYRLIVTRDPTDPAYWLIRQSPQPAPPPSHANDIVLQFAGHGLSFRIDRCTGAISRLYYSR